MKVVVLDSFLVNYGLSGLPLDSDFSVVYYENTAKEDVLSRIEGAHAVFVNRTPLDAEALRSPSLRFVGTLGTGYNHVDILAAAQANVTVCNVPAYSTQAVAQHTISLLLNICCQTAAHDQYVKRGLWISANDPPLAGRGSFELEGKTIGLVGYGNIAHRVGLIAHSLGMNVLACKRNPISNTNIPFVTFEALLEQSDVVSIHCPLTAETTGLINEAALARMRWGSVLLNTARGAILDTASVLDALNSGKLLMAGIDVFDHEPAGASHPLASHPHVIATPHVAWSPVETRQRLLKISAENLLAFLRGNPQNVVRPDACQ